MKEKNQVVPDEVLSKEFLSQFKTEADVSRFLNQLHAQVLEKMLEGEMDAHLGYEKNSVAGNNTGNSRNGSYPKKIQTGHGESVISIPRDRNGQFEPIAVPKHESRGLSIEKLVISLYAKGMSVSDIEEEMREIYEIELSTSAISIITNKVSQAAQEWQNRPLDPFYTTVFFDAIRVKIRGDNGIVTPKAVHLALGVNAQGRKEVLGMWVADNESAKYWLKVFTELKNRGVSDILIAVTDGLKGMKEALEAAFPNTLLQTCIVHLIRNSLKFVGYKDYKAVAGALKPIYRAVNAADARKELDAFAQSELGLRYPYIAKQWIDSWDKVIPFFDFSPNIRRLIYTTNAIESLNRDLRKVIKTRAAFPTETAALKLLFLAIRKVEKRWVRPSPYWSAAMRELVVLFGDRITPYID